MAAVDLGSNSFRLLIAKQEGGQIVPISTHREGVRLAAGLDRNNELSRSKIDEAVAALGRFRERLTSVAPKRVRAVATSTYRTATNSQTLLSQSQRALGLPIDIVSGPEEARLIYLGCAHTLPWSNDERLIVDIGGGSTEFIVGTQYTPELMESFALGAVTLSQHFFPNGTVTSAAFRKADIYVRSRLEVLHARYKQGWATAYGSSGTVRALHEIVSENGFDSGLTFEGLLKLQRTLIDAGDVTAVTLSALKSSRAPVLPGGLAILLGLMRELRIERVDPAEGALRLGALYDMLDREGAEAAKGGQGAEPPKRSQRDPRTLTVARLQKRYDVDVAQAARVASAAQTLWRSLGHTEIDPLLEWASGLHEVGMAIAHPDYHKHSAYVLAHADLYGFSEQERADLVNLVLGHTGSLKKLTRESFNNALLERLACLRVAAIYSHGRSPVALSAQLSAPDDSWTAFRLRCDAKELDARPLTLALLEEDAERWEKFGVPLIVEMH
ncbi:MAG: Ppx/GppA family phosphatase [Betaproteobacteria bacterium]|nr:MAG: Ppx/GppA family phosphatase [Betaproteobacteria bacterium]